MLLTDPLTRHRQQQQQRAAASPCTRGSRALSPWARCSARLSRCCPGPAASKETAPENSISSNIDSRSFRMLQAMLQRTSSSGGSSCNSSSSDRCGGGGGNCPRKRPRRRGTETTVMFPSCTASFTTNQTRFLLFCSIEVLSTVRRRCSHFQPFLSSVTNDQLTNTIKTVSVLQT